MEVCEGMSAIITHLNHLKDLCALVTGCVNSGAEGWSHPSEKAAPCEVPWAVDLVTSQLSGPCEMPFVVGLGELRRWEGERGALGALLKLSMGRAGEPAVPGVCPAGRPPVRWHKDVAHWLTPPWNRQPLWCSARSPGAPGVGSGAMTATMQEGRKPSCSLSRREITYLVLKASHSALSLFRGRCCLGMPVSWMRKVSGLGA